MTPAQSRRPIFEPTPKKPGEYVMTSKGLVKLPEPARLNAFGEG